MGHKFCNIIDAGNGKEYSDDKVRGYLLDLRMLERCHRDDHVSLLTFVLVQKTASSRCQYHSASRLYLEASPTTDTCVCEDPVLATKPSINVLHWYKARHLHRIALASPHIYTGIFQQDLCDSKVQRGGVSFTSNDSGSAPYRSSDQEHPIR